MATIGDPLMDLGTTLGYWVEPGRRRPSCALLRVRPDDAPRQPDAAASWSSATPREAAATSRAILFYYVFGLFKIAVIAQQIYFRYRQGLTHDERFANLIGAVRILGRTASRAMETGRIDHLES